MVLLGLLRLGGLNGGPNGYCRLHKVHNYNTFWVGLLFNDDRGEDIISIVGDGTMERQILLILER